MSETKHYIHINEGSIDLRCGYRPVEWKLGVGYREDYSKINITTEESKITCGNCKKLAKIDNVRKL